MAALPANTTYWVRRTTTATTTGYETTTHYAIGVDCGSLSWEPLCLEVKEADVRFIAAYHVRKQALCSYQGIKPQCLRHSAMALQALHARSSLPCGIIPMSHYLTRQKGTRRYTCLRKA